MPRRAAKPQASRDSQCAELVSQIPPSYTCFEGQQESDMTLENMISSLTRDEKLAAMDLIWRDLTTDSQLLPSAQWHEAEIAHRLANPAPGRPLPLVDAKAEIKEAIDARRASR
jgi:hypothetical protein